MLLLTLGGAGGAYYMLRGDRPDPKPSQPATAPVAITPDAAPATPAAPAVPSPRPRESIRRPPPARLVVRRIRVYSKTGRLKVRVTVPGAPDYTRKTPFTVDARHGERVTLVARRPGFHSKTRRLVVISDLRVVFALTLLERPRPMVTEPPAMRPMSYGESTISPFEKK